MSRVVPALAALACVVTAACNQNPADPPEARMYVPEEGVSFIEANGIEFAYYDEGEGPLVLLLHGFPDTARTWDDVRPVVAAAGFRVVAPYMRGYAPTAVPEDGRFDAEALGTDVLALIEALGHDSAIVVGHDWGASAAYAAAGIDAGRVDKLVTVAIPHPAAIALDPQFFENAEHFVYLAAPTAEALMQAGDFAHVDALYARWSPTWDVPANETEAVKNAFTAPGCLDAALGYYRDVPMEPPAFFVQPITVPTLTFAGVDDGVTAPDAFDGVAFMFAGSYTVERVAGGHFVHRESPDAFLDALLAFLAE